MDTPKPGNGNGKTNGNGHGDPKPSGMSPSTALLVGLIMALLGLGGAGVMLYLSKSERVRLQEQMRRLVAEQQRNEAEAARTRSENVRLTEQNNLEATKQQAEFDRFRKQTEMQQVKAQEDAKLTVARNQQAEVLHRARNCTNVLMTLMQQIIKLQADATTLGTNDQGKVMARHADLVALARRFYETELSELPAPEDVIPRIENARRIDVQLLEAANTTFQPTPEMSVGLQDQVIWADSISRKIGSLQKTMASLIREAQIKFSPQPPDATSATLQAAIRNLTLSESAARQREVVKATSEADQQAATLVTTAEVDKTLTEAKLKAERIVKDAEEKAAQQRREMELKQAQAKVTDAKTQAAKQQTEDEAVKVKLRERLADPTLKGKLAPFLTPGHWTPAGMTYEKKPHSYNMLVRRGALEQTIDGMQSLMDIAYDPADKERPRWRFGGSIRYWRNKPSAVEEVKAAQTLLIELGEVMVEAKMLEP